VKRKPSKRRELAESGHWPVAGPEPIAARDVGGEGFARVAGRGAARSVHAGRAQGTLAASRAWCCSSVVATDGDDSG
jgi:hypothetical protein